MDDVRDDILSYAESGDSSYEEQDAALDQKQYTKTDENRERERAAQAIFMEKNKIQSQDQNFMAELKQLKEILIKQNTEKEDLKKQLEEIKGHVSVVKEDSYNRSLKEIMDKVKSEQKSIIDDPILSEYYDEKEVIENMTKNSSIGKVLTPKEQLAILKFESIVKENAELKKKLDNRGMLLNRSIGPISSSKAKSEDDSVDVRELSDAEYQAYKKKQQLKALEAMLG